jgi:DNA-binding transcriptional MerR regulator
MPDLSIGRLAKEAEVKVPTIRFYEQIGLMPTPARTQSDQRVYGPEAIQRLRFIRHARLLGFEIKDIEALLGLADRPNLPCAEADRIAQDHLEAVDQKIDQLTRLRAELVRMTTNCGLGIAADCKVIEVLSDHRLCQEDRH